MTTLATKEIIDKVNEAPNMDKFFIEGTTETPEITLDKNEGKIRFSGRSMPEDAKGFYSPIKNWIEAYKENPVKGTEVIFAYEYFNTASSKMIMEIIELIQEVTENDPELRAEWHYQQDDDDMLEAGKDYEDITELKFEYIGYE